jgi:DNA sulfur modification protein DndD
VKIISLVLNNFASYYGDHTFDFDTDTGNDGYAIFGHEGTGKSSIMWAILWCLYGKVEATHLYEGEMKSMNRPVLDASQMGGSYKKKWYAPLLTDKAFESKEYNISVTLTFEHNGQRFVLLRKAKATKSNPINDTDMKIKAHLSVDNTTISTALIDGVIEEIIPQRVSRFFFIEMDALDQYANLLFGSEPGSAVREDVESILGLPAIDRSEDDFRRLAKSAEGDVTKHKKKESTDKKTLKKIKSAEETKKEIKKDLREFNNDIKGANKRIEEIDIILSTESTAKELLEKKETTEKRIKELEAELDKLYIDRAEMMSGTLWMSLIQSNLETVMDNLDERNKEKDELVTKAVKAEQQIVFKQSLLDKGSTECEACGHTTEGIGTDERDEVAAQVAELNESHNSLRKEIDTFGDPVGSIIALSKFRNSTGHSSVMDTDHFIGEKIVKIGTNNKRLNGISDELENHDVSLIAILSREKVSLIELRGDQKAGKSAAKKFLQSIEATHKRLVGKLPSGSGSTKVKEAELREKVFLWLSDTFQQSLELYLAEARESVQKQSTETFLATIPESAKYKGITISENWEIEVIGVNNKPKVIINPGHKQVIAVSLFDGLRETSRRTFPTFFDNPGSNIADETLAKVAKHFWGIERGQIVMLSHGGGLKTDETIESYGDKLACAWELSYVSGEETLTQIEKLL